jgi:hypothetical protein
MIHRGIATLAMALLVCFLMLSYFDPGFFFLHFYESLIYIVIVLMLFYLEDRWAYMLGILAPAGWLVLTLVTGGFGEFFRQLGDVLRGQEPNYGAAVLAGLASILSVVMLVCCAYRWKREFAGQGKTWSTLIVGLVIVVAYYAVLVAWFFRAASSKLT